MPYYRTRGITAAAILGIALAGCHDGAPTREAPKAATRQPTTTDRETARLGGNPEYTGDGSWQMLELPGGIRAVGVSAYPKPVRLVVPQPSDGYSIYRLSVDCPSKAVTVLDGVRSAHDTRPPDRSDTSTPKVALGIVADAVCRAKDGAHVTLSTIAKPLRDATAADPRMANYELIKQHLANGRKQ